MQENKVNFHTIINTQVIPLVALQSSTRALVKKVLLLSTENMKFYSSKIRLRGKPLRGSKRQ